MLALLVVHIHWGGVEMAAKPAFATLTLPVRHCNCVGGTAKKSRAQKVRVLRRATCALEPAPACTAYCVMRTENIFVCWCSVGSDRAAGMGVSLGTLDLVRVDGRLCLGR